jgi:DNA-binding NarL/FixJ family response regulator
MSVSIFPPWQTQVSARLVGAAEHQVPVSIVDDGENDRLLIKRILDGMRDFHCLNSYSSGDAALVGIPRCPAEIVLMDIRMPGMSGIECTRRLKALLPHLKIIMLTVLDEVATFHRAVEAGCDAYLIKPFSTAQMLASLICCRLPAAGTGVNVSADARREALDPREIAVANLVSRGLTDKQIADQLRVSKAVVEKLLKRVRRKLHAANRAQVAHRFHS